MKKRFQLLALSVLCAVFAHAQFVAPSEGVFRIINVGYDAALMENYETNKLRCTSTIGDADDFDQLWVLKRSGSGYSIQNAYTGAYIQTGNTGSEVPYWTGTTAKTFNITQGGSKKGYNIFDPNLDGQGLHSKGANGNVVRWVDCEPSEWKFEKVEVSKEAMALVQAEYAEYVRLKTEFEKHCAELLANQDKFEAALAKYFADAACTVLKAEFASANTEDLRAAMTADKLPAELIDMAVKVKTGEWAEDNEKANKPGWNSHYAKKFRVQMVEPHSIAGEITEWIGHQGHTNMDNPTGLYGNYRQVLYVMVEGEIKEGAELYATWLVGHTKMPNYNNGYGESGVSLKPGLNIIPIRNNGSALYFNYLVHTLNIEREANGRPKYDKNGALMCEFAHKLSDYDDLKIHVAGGYINGYYNVEGDALYTPDNDDDWVYYEERANLENITILGRYEVLQFELNDVVNYTDDKGSTWSEKGLAYYFPEKLPTKMPNSPAFTAPNQRINGIVEAWDRIFLSEKMTLGVASKADVDSMNKLFPRYDGTWKEKAEIYNYDDELLAFCDSIKNRDGDYGEYYNHRGVAFGTRTGYMYGSWDHSGYHINTTHSILACIATEAGPTWGPAHEIGHQHQALYTLNGEMEVTNNTFANIAAWYMGMGTSRVNGTEGNLAHVYDNYKNGGYLLSNNIWALTQRYYRLWLYYHRVGNNTQFFPRLFELIRLHPMERSYGSGSEMRPNDKGVMENVGFQLTNGYRSYLHFYKLCCEAAQEDLTEFFRAYGCFTPVDGVFQGDYTNSKYYTTQQEIDKAIAEVKAKGYPENFMPLFINDCTPTPTYGHDGKTQREYWDGNVTQRGENGETGIYVDYLNGTPITGAYQYDLNGATIRITGGQGAVGFAIFNDQGEIQAFSNNHSFELNDSVYAHMVIYNDYVLKAIAADTNHVVIPMVASKESLSGTYEYTLSNNQITFAGGKNALAFGIYNKENKLVAMSKSTSYKTTDEISRGLALGELEVRAHGAHNSVDTISILKKDLEGDYIFALSGNTVKISGGKNALVYIVYDENNKEQAYSGLPTFDVTEDIATQLIAETSCILAIGSNGNDSVKFEIESFFLAALESAKAYASCIDSTNTKIGMLYPDSIYALEAAIAEADSLWKNNLRTQYNRSILTLDSTVAALLANKKARVPLKEDIYYTIAVATNAERLMGSKSAGLSTSTNGVTDNASWRIIPTEEPSVYYLKNRETGKYISYVASGKRVKAEATDITSAVQLKLVAADPGKFHLQVANNAELRLYNTGGNQNYVYGGDVDTDAAKWFITVEDDLLGMPDTSKVDQMVIYHIQSTDNGQFAYYNKNDRMTPGGIFVRAIDEKNYTNHWFYFTPGSEEGKFVIYNYASDKSVTTKETKLNGVMNNAIYATGDTLTEYTIALNEEGTSLVISADSSWYAPTGQITRLSAQTYTPWKLERIGTISVAMEQETASVEVESTVELKEKLIISTLEPTAKWSSSDKSIATVDKNGVVKGIAEGTVTITATVGTMSATCVVTVLPASGIDAITAGLNVQVDGSVITVEGIANGTEVSAYNAAGSLIGTTVASNGTATIDTNLTKGSIAIVKIGTDYAKVTVK